MLPTLIATDVDGTLLDDDELVTPRTRAAVLAAVDAGTQFVLATGRPPRWIAPVVDALGFAPMAVCANGAVIYDSATDRILSATDAVGRACSRELAEMATRVIPGAGLAVERVGRSAHDAATPQFVSSPGYEHAWLNPDNTEVSLEDLLERARGQAADPQGGRAQRGHGGGTGRARRPAGRSDLLDQQRSDRGGAARHQQGHRRRGGGARRWASCAEDVVTFGDMPNDIPMLRWAGLGVAMGNAHPEAMAAADEVTAPNTDDGLARVLERWWLVGLRPGRRSG